MSITDTKRKLDPHALAEAALMADIGVLTALLRFYLPIVGTALHFFEPLPIILLVYRRGLRAGFMATIVGYLLTNILAGPSVAFWLLRLCANGLVLGNGMRRGWSAWRTIVTNTIVMFFIGIFFFAFALWAFGIGPEDVRRDTTQFYEWIRDSGGWLLGFVGLQQWWQTAAIPIIEPVALWFINNWLVSALTFMIMYYFANSIGYYWLTEPLLKRFGITIPHLNLEVPFLPRHQPKTAPLQEGEA